MNKLITSWTKHQDTQGLLSLERIPMRDTVKTGIVSLNEDLVTRIVEKPSPEEAASNISSTPLYVFSCRILDYLPRAALSMRGEYELQDPLQMMIDDGHLVRGLFLQDRLALTTAEDLLAINLGFLDGEAFGRHIDTQEIGQGTNFVKPIYIEAGVKIGSECNIGPGVYIEKNASIGDGVRLENVVVLHEADVKDGVVLRDQVIF
jgi:NDP-sugar pyrophosphorylase family protein